MGRDAGLLIVVVPGVLEQGTQAAALRLRQAVLVADGVKVARAGAVHGAGAIAASRGRGRRSRRACGGGLLAGCRRAELLALLALLALLVNEGDA